MDHRRRATNWWRQTDDTGADAIVRASRNDLYLYFLGRDTGEPVQIAGDTEMLARCHSAIGLSPRSTRRPEWYEVWPTPENEPPTIDRDNPGQPVVLVPPTVQIAVFTMAILAWTVVA